MNSRRTWNVALAAVLMATIAAAQEAQTRDTEYPVAMRDGVRLMTSVYLPEGEGPWPAVVARTPYNKDGVKRRAQMFNDAGFVFVGQDTRGKFKSEGEFIPFDRDREDGYDTIEWIASQPWCDGNVGITGGSALGIAGNRAAAEAPPHLKAAYVVVAPEGLFHQSRFIGGVFKESHAGGWMRKNGAGDQVDAIKKRVLMDDDWRRTDFVHHRHKVKIPVYNVGGWYDIFSQGNINNFVYLQEEGQEGARGNQKLLMGPFGHGAISGDLEYPEGGSLRTGHEEIRWFEYWLKGVDNGIMDEPPVRYYMMAAARKDRISPHNRWIEADAWPPPGRELRLYLTNERGLSSATPTWEYGQTGYRHDPSNPVPTVGGLNLRIDKGPMDQRAIGDRPDYIRFETGVLEKDHIVAGNITCELFASTDGADTDFMVKLVDVYPDGYEAIVLDAPIRTRYRNGRNPGDVEFMTPGKPERLLVDLWSTALTFEKGHKIAVHVSSSNYPRFEVNPNTGEAPGEYEVPPRIATNTIYHHRDMPSALVLPIVEEE